MPKSNRMAKFFEHTLINSNFSIALHTFIRRINQNRAAAATAALNNWVLLCVWNEQKLKWQIARMDIGIHCAYQLWPNVYIIPLLCAFYRCVSKCSVTPSANAALHFYYDLLANKNCFENHFNNFMKVLRCKRLNLIEWINSMKRGSALCKFWNSRIYCHANNNKKKMGPI